MKHFISSILIVLLSTSLHAQIVNSVYTGMIVGRTTYDAISPENNRQISNRLFNLDEKDVQFRLIVNLKNDNYLLIECTGLSNWRERGELKKITAIAANATMHIIDSFRNPTSAKTVSIHVPIQNEPLTMKYIEYNTDENTVMLNGNEQAPLKIGMDTVRLLKTFADSLDEDSKQHILKQVQYTFLLKDVSQIKDVAMDSELINKISDTADSIAYAYKRRWKKPDLWFHNITVKYNAFAQDTQKSLAVEKNNMSYISGYRTRGKITTLDLEGRMGISMIRDQFSPELELGISYKWKEPNDRFGYAGIYYSGYFMYYKHPDSTYTATGISFINAEVGAYFTSRASFVPLRRLALGLGYMTESNDPYMSGHYFKEYFSYGLTTNLTIGFEIVGNGHSQDAFYGANLKFQLF